MRSTRCCTLAAMTCLTLVLLPTAAKAELVGLSWQGMIYRIDESTGTGTQLGQAVSAGLNSAASDPAGTVYSAAGRLIVIHPFTATSEAGPTLTPASFDVRAMAYSPEGFLYAARNVDLPDGTHVSDELYTVDAGTGATTSVGSIGMPGIQGMAFSPGGVLYGWDDGAGTGAGAGLVTIDTTTALATDVNPAVGGSALHVQTLEFTPDGTLYGARDALYTVDVQSGELTLVGSGGYSNLRGLAFVVPEPSTAAMLGLGVFSLLAYALCRRRR